MEKGKGLDLFHKGNDVSLFYTGNCIWRFALANSITPQCSPNFLQYTKFNPGAIIRQKGPKLFKRRVQTPNLRDTFILTLVNSPLVAVV